jgi:putative aldouronate transport system substrate-binding protein
MVWNNFDEALGLEVTQGLADHGPADGEPIAQVAFDQPLARLVLERQNGLAQAMDHLLAERRGDQLSGRVGPTVAPTAAGQPHARLQLPAYQPVAGIEPDLPGTDAGLQAGYLSYPKDLVKSVPQPPGLGNDVTALTQTSVPIPSPLDQNPAWQEVDKQLNANLKMTLVPISDYPTRVAATMAGNDLPDVFFFDQILAVGNMPQFLQASYTDLAPFLGGENSKDYPNLAAFPTTSWAQATFNGGPYALPLIRPAFNYTWFYNQSQFDAIGASQPRTSDDFKRVLKELTNPQQGRYGIGAMSPTYGLLFSGRGDVPQLAMFGVPNNWSVDTAGNFTKDIETDRFKAAVGFVRDLYASGVFFPDPTMNPVTLRQNFIAAKYAVMALGWASYPIIWDASLKLQPRAKFRTLAPFSADGSQPTWHRFNGVNGLTAIKKGSPERVKELLRIMNFLAAPFGSQESLLLDFGVKDVDFNFDARGKPIATQKGQADLTVRWNYLATRPQVLFDPNDADFAQAAYADEKALLASLVDDPSLGLYSRTDASKGGQLTQRFADGLGDVVTGRGSLDALDQMIRDWRSAGGDQMRAEYQQAYADARSG